MRGWAQSFDKLMKSPAGRNVFREFLRTEYSEENMLFWLACEELKNECNKHTIDEKARMIYEDYISILSPKEVRGRAPPAALRGVARGKMGLGGVFLREGGTVPAAAAAIWGWGGMGGGDEFSRGRGLVVHGGGEGVPGPPQNPRGAAGQGLGCAAGLKPHEGTSGPKRCRSAQHPQSGGTPGGGGAPQPTSLCPARGHGEDPEASPLLPAALSKTPWLRCKYAPGLPTSGRPLRRS